MWFLVVAYVVALALAVAMQPQPEDAKPAGLQDFNVPTATQGRSIPVVFGTVVVKSPNVVWYGDLGRRAIKKKTGLFGKTKIGYKYYLGMHMIVSYGPVDELQEIIVDDRVIYTGPISTTQTISISKEGLWGGKEEGGGISGNLDVEFGMSGQVQNSYLQSKLGTNDIPAFRGMMGFVLNHMYIGTQQNVKNWAFKLKRVPTELDAATADINGNANPAHVLYEVLTNAEWGMGYPSSSLDTTSFLAAATTLYAENFGIATVWDSQVTIEEFVKNITDMVNAALYIDPVSGLFVMKMIRDDYVVGDLPVFNEVNVVDVDSFERKVWSETVNELKVIYKNPDTGDDVPVTVQDLAVIQIQSGQVISQTRKYPMVTDGDLALILAQRDLTVMSTPLAKVELLVNRDAYDLNPADPFVFSWDKYGIDQLVLRVVKIGVGGLDGGQIRLECIEDVFGLPSSSFSSAQDPQWTTPISAPADVAYRTAFEQTYFDLVQEVGLAEVNALAADKGYALYAGASPTGDSIIYELWTWNTLGYYELAQEDADFCPYAALVGDLGQAVTSVINYTGEIDEEGFELNTFVVIDDEICQITGIDTAANSMTLKRGILDTVPVAHSDGAGIFGYQHYYGKDPKFRTTSQTATLKALPVTSLGTLAEGSATSENVPIVGRKDKPYPPGAISVEGLYGYPTDVMTSGDGVLTFGWFNRDRTQQLANVYSQTSSNVGPEAGATYSYQIYGDDALLVNVTGDTSTGYAWITEATPYHSKIRFTIWTVVSGRASLQPQDYTFYRADYGFSYGRTYGGV